MKKILFAAAMAAGVLAYTSCDDQLDTTNYAKKDTSSFPVSQKDAEQIVNSIYNALWLTVSSEAEECTMFVSDMAGDDMFGGGSTSNTGSQGLDRLMWDETEGLDDSWEDLYIGLYRSNYALEAIPEMDDALFDSADTKNYLIGQAHFLRAWYTWELTQLFETFPMLTATATVNNPRSDVETIYQQLATDLTQAIELMPAKYTYSLADGQAGRATRYAAEGMLGRIWMFYTGFYGKDNMGGISKSQVISYLEDCRDKSGFGLENDPREIWPYTNEYSSGFAYGQDFDTYASRNNLHWVGNHSKETIWGVHFSYVYYDTSTRMGFNRIGEWMGLRNPSSSPNAESYPYGIGYTNGPVNTKLVEEWATDPDYGFDDIRLWGSIFAVDNAEELFGANGTEGTWMAGQPVELASHKGNDSKEVEKTMFHQKKYMVSVAYDGADKKTLYKNFFYAIPGFSGSNSNQYDNRNDVVYLRYADVLLMIDELKQTTDGMNKLRQRAGLKPYDSYSFERLQKERRYELCFEGIRWNDLRRWYPKEAGSIISKNQCGAFMEYRGKKIEGGYAENVGNGMAKRYAETRGFWRIPNVQITLSEGVLTQTPGWENEKSAEWLFGNGSLPYKK